MKYARINVTKTKIIIKQQVLSNNYQEKRATNNIDLK